MKFLKSIHIVLKNLLTTFMVIFGFGQQVRIYRMQIIVHIKIRSQSTMKSLCVINMY